MRGLPELVCGLALATLVGVACTAPSKAPALSVETPVPAEPSRPVASISPEPAAQPAVDKAMEEAVKHTSLAPADIKVVQVEAREWPDSALGCPQPGLMYSQIVTPGYLVVVQAGTRVLEYHSDTRGRVVLCQER